MHNMVTFHTPFAKKSDFPKTCHNNMPINGKSRPITDSNDSKFKFGNFNNYQIVCTIY